MMAAHEREQEILKTDRKGRSESEREKEIRGKAKCTRA